MLYPNHLSTSRKGKICVRKIVTQRSRTGSNMMTKHLRVAVVDRAPAGDAALWSPPAVPDARVSTVTESSIKFFVSSGAWSYMVQHAQEFGSMQVWSPTFEQQVQAQNVEWSG
jgi:2-polyprenyl-6-methoxyphenol hydroxylase-like FAD-dependent oxidoreductase